MDSRTKGLGALAVLPDEVLDFLFRGLDAKSLCIMSCVSKVARIFALEEPLWQDLHLARCKQPFEYRGSWRATYLACNPACDLPTCTAALLRPPFRVEAFSSMFLYRRWYRCHVDLSTFVPEQEAIPRVEGQALSAAQFEEQYDGPGQPILLSGLTHDWKVGEWSPAQLEARLGPRLFKASKPSGGRIRMGLSHYLHYSAAQHDEEPVYIFDADFGETAPELLADYHVPPLFAHDLFGALGYARDEYRWLVMGPPRSGASWHIDPAATSAWNTSVTGRKRWALYPPGKVPPGVVVHVHPSGDPEFRSPTSLQWFLEVYPHLTPEQRPLEVVQGPGDTIFLPAGWWHCVLNLDMTVAVTHNFVSHANLEGVVGFLALGAGAQLDAGLVPAFLDKRERIRRGSGEGAALAAREVEGAPGGIDPADDSSSDEDGDSSASSGADVSLATHLRESLLGFSRGGVLGTWLRTLWQSVPSMRDRLAELAGRYTDVEVWRRRVEAVCARAGLPAPQPYEAFPVAGGEGMVFLVGDAVLKFFNTHVYPAGLAMWQMEVAAYHSMKRARAQAPDTHGSFCGSNPPRLLHADIMPREQSATCADTAALDDTASTGGEVVVPPTLYAGLPYLLVSRSPGVTLGSLLERLSLEQWREVGAAVGAALAAMHSLPLPQAPPHPAACGCGAETCTQSTSGGVRQLAGGVCTAWLSHSGTAWSSLHGRLEKAEWGRLQGPAWAKRLGGPPAAGACKAGAAGAQQEGIKEEEAAAVEALPARLQLFPLVPLVQDAGPTTHGQTATAGCTTHDQAATAGCTTEEDERAAKRARTVAGHGHALLNGSAAAAENSGSKLAEGEGTAWAPFLDFLRYRLQRALRPHAWEGVLPEHLAKQIAEYLPQDPAILLGLPTAQEGATCDQQPAQSTPNMPAASASLPLPTWLHGDLTAENMLVQLPNGGGGASDGTTSSGNGCGGIGVVLIDFADGGQGDPLWDLVPLFIRSLKCNPDTLRHCLAAYQRQMLSHQRTAPHSSAPFLAMLAPRGGPQALAAACQSNGTVGAEPYAAAAANRSTGAGAAVTLSYVATCYTLLHELDMAESALKRMPALWEAPSLHHLQQRLWGALDEPLLLPAEVGL